MASAPGAIPSIRPASPRAGPGERRRAVLAGSGGDGECCREARCCRRSPACSWRPDDAAMAMTAGPLGADLLCMQFPKHARD